MYAIVNGIRLYYEVHGKPAGVPLLFIHGFPLSGEMWRGVIKPLEADYRLIIPDLRGHGRSEVAAHVQPGVSPAISIADYADDLATLLEEIGEQRPVVVIGLSMGGYIAFEFYRRYTNQVFALVLADTRAGADSPPRQREREQTARRLLEEGCDALADTMAERLFAPTTPAEVRERWRRLMRETPREGAAAAMLAMAARPDSTPMLPAILCPTLIVVGRQDVITDVHEARLMHESIQASELVVIADAGHVPPIEQPAAFADALQRFLARHLPPGPWGGLESD